MSPAIEESPIHKLCANAAVYYGGMCRAHALGLFWIACYMRVKHWVHSTTISPPIEEVLFLQCVQMLFLQCVQMRRFTMFYCTSTFHALCVYTTDCIHLLYLNIPYSMRVYYWLHSPTICLQIEGLPFIKFIPANSRIGYLLSASSCCALLCWHV